MRKATVISTGMHAAVLLWATLSFSGKTFDVTPAESLPVDMISEKDFSELTKGAKDAPKLDTPKPLVEKKAEEPPKPIEDSKPKVTEKQEVQTAKEASAPPDPQPPKPDPIAEKIKQKDEPKQETKVEQPLPPKKPPPKPQPKFDADKIAALLDKRDPQRNATTGAELNQVASLGAANATAAQLSQSEIDALRARLRQCWNPPVGVVNAANQSVVFRVLFNRNGSIAGNPVLVGGPPSQMGPVLAESAKRALLQCQPYTMLKPEHYDQWKDMQITFDPRDMFGG
jgi:hypothetical protein